MRVLLIGFALALGTAAAAQPGGSAPDRAYDEMLAAHTALQKAESARKRLDEPAPGAAAFDREVDLRLEVPAPVKAYYAKRLDDALARAGVEDARPQYILLVDRSAHVQAGFLYWRSPEAAWHFIGASPVATGRPGEYEHFLTPLGAFAHSLANPDFRAEGTRNELGIRGYGVKGMRVYDFGWVEAERTWDPGGVSRMRLQVHSTDPDLLEPLLGT